MYLLAAHIQNQLQLYGTVGYLCEDFLESIHAIVNTFAKIYCMCAPQHRRRAVMQSLHARELGKRKVHATEKVKK